MRPGCEPVRGWPLPGRGNQSICHRQTGWTQSGTGVFLGLKASQGPPLGGVAQALTHMGDWCGSVQTVRQPTQRNDGCANGTTPARRRRPQGFPARHFPRERGAANRSQWRGATGKIRKSKVHALRGWRNATGAHSPSRGSPEYSSLSKKSSRRLRRSVFCLTKPFNG